MKHLSRVFAQNPSILPNGVTNAMLCKQQLQQLQQQATRQKHHLGIIYELLTSSLATQVLQATRDAIASRRKNAAKHLSRVFAQHPEQHPGEWGDQRHVVQQQLQLHDRNNI